MKQSTSDWATAHRRRSPRKRTLLKSVAGRRPAAPADPRRFRSTPHPGDVCLLREHIVKHMAEILRRVRQYDPGLFVHLKQSFLTTTGFRSKLEVFSSKPKTPQYLAFGKKKYQNLPIVFRRPSPAISGFCHLRPVRRAAKAAAAAKKGRVRSDLRFFNQTVKISTLQLLKTTAIIETNQTGNVRNAQRPS